MKKRDIEKMLKEDIQNSVPDISSRLPFDFDAGDNGGGEVLVKKKNHFKIIFAGVALVLATVLILLFCLPKGGGLNNFTSVNFGNGGFLTIDINPSVQMSLDKEGKVTKVTLLNDDAIVMLEGKTDSFIGKTAEEASSMLFDSAQRTGYFKLDSKTNAMLVSSYLGAPEEEQKLNTNVKLRLQQSFIDAGMYGVVITETRTLTDKEQADVYGITPSKMHLINTAISLGVAINESEYADISVSEIYSRMEERAELLQNFGGEDILDKWEQFEEESEERLEEFAEMLEELGEDLAEYIEDFVEDIPYIDEETIEKLLEDIEDLSEEIAEKMEDGKKNLEQLIGELKNCLGKVKEIIESVHIDALVDEFLLKLDDLTEGYEILRQETEQAKNSFLEEQNRREEQYKNNYAGSFDLEKFEKEYEDWLDEMEDYYEEHWDELKEKWDRD